MSSDASLTFDSDSCRWQQASAFSRIGTCSLAVLIRSSLAAVDLPGPMESANLECTEQTGIGLSLREGVAGGRYVALEAPESWRPGVFADMV